MLLLPPFCDLTHTDYLAERDTYGKWPASGEIDIAESRGNFGDDYTSGGRDSLIGALHWGPVPEKDAFYKTSGQHQVRRTDYSQKFHTFGVEVLSLASA